MGYKQKGFPKHATKSSFKVKDSLEMQKEIRGGIRDIQKRGGTDKEIREYVDSKSDLATAYVYDDEGNISTVKRDAKKMDNLYKRRMKDGKYQYDDDEAMNKRRRIFDKLPGGDKPQHLEHEGREVTGHEIDGIWKPSAHESGGSMENPALRDMILRQNTRRKEGALDELDTEDFSGYDDRL